jgi:hypothetical protein
VIGAGLLFFCLPLSCLDRKINWNTATALTACVACYLFFSNFVYGDSDARVTSNPWDALKTSQLCGIGFRQKLGFPDGWLVLAIDPCLCWRASGFEPWPSAGLVRRGVQTCLGFTVDWLALSCSSDPILPTCLTPGRCSFGPTST